MAGEPEGQRRAHLRGLPHQQMVGDDCSPLCFWVSAWGSGFGPLTRFYGLPLLLFIWKKGACGAGSCP